MMMTLHLPRRALLHQPFLKRVALLCAVVLCHITKDGVRSELNPSRFGDSWFAPDSEADDYVDGDSMEPEMSYRDLRDDGFLDVDETILTKVVYRLLRRRMKTSANNVRKRQTGFMALDNVDFAVTTLDTARKLQVEEKESQIQSKDTHHGKHSKSNLPDASRNPQSSSLDNRSPSRPSLLPRQSKPGLGRGKPKSGRNPFEMQRNGRPSVDISPQEIRRLISQMMNAGKRADKNFEII